MGMYITACCCDSQKNYLVRYCISSIDLFAENFMKILKFMEHGSGDIQSSQTDISHKYKQD